MGGDYILHPPDMLTQFKTGTEKTALIHRNGTISRYGVKGVPAHLTPASMHGQVLPLHSVLLLWLIGSSVRVPGRRQLLITYSLAGWVATV